MGKAVPDRPSRGCGADSPVTPGLSEALTSDGGRGDRNLGPTWHCSGLSCANLQLSSHVRPSFLAGKPRIRIQGLRAREIA